MLCKWLPICHHNSFGLQKANHTNAFKQPPCFPYLSCFRCCISPLGANTSGSTTTLPAGGFPGQLPGDLLVCTTPELDAGGAVPWMAMKGRGQNQMHRLNEKDWTSSSEAIYSLIYICIHYTLHSYCFFFSGLLHLIVWSSKIPLRVHASGRGA